MFPKPTTTGQAQFIKAIALLENAMSTAKIQDTVAAKALHATIGELLRDEVPQLPSDRSREKFWRLMLESVAKNLPKPKEARAEPKPEKQQQPKREPTGSEADALELIEQIEDLADSICEAGEDFAASMLETARDIGETVERVGYITENQLRALRNILEGLEAWHHD